MDLSQEFNQEEACDLVLHLDTDGNNDGRKRPRSPSQHARSFFVHRVILRQSPYFKALLLRRMPVAAESNAANAAASPETPARPELLLHVDHEDELESFEVMLKCMYQAGLPEEAQMGRSRLLLQVRSRMHHFEGRLWNNETTGSDSARRKRVTSPCRSIAWPTGTRSPAHAWSQFWQPCQR